MNPPLLLTFDLQYEDVVHVVMGTEALVLRGSDIRVGLHRVAELSREPLTELQDRRPHAMQGLQYQRRAVGKEPDKPVVADEASVTLPVAAVEAAVAAAALAPIPETAPQDPSRKWWLWGALGVGLLLLAGMAWSLFASLRKDRAADD